MRCGWLGTMIAAMTMVVCGLSLVANAQETIPGPPREQSTEVDSPDVEVMARGPVHEAFAEAIVFNPLPGLNISKEPPQEVKEIPSQQPVSGQNTAWIPGYWGWDDDRSDFIWVSGFWRVLPPGRQWVPGYWYPTTNQQWQWTSGYWAAADLDEVGYLPAPPENIEAGPSTDAPDHRHFWMPGCWYWHNGEYMWHAGRWELAHDRWVWVPSHYVWTPRGYVFINGYWDYPLDHRGMLYAPVVFHSPIYRQPDYYFHPRFFVDLGLMAEHLFVRPTYRHYYFGDYYAENDLRFGIQPWFEFHNQYGGYDPFFVYQNYRRGNRDWVNQVADEYRERRNNENRRPSREVRIARADEPTSGDSLVRSIAQMELGENQPVQFREVTTAQRAEIEASIERMREFRGTRTRLESGAQAERGDRRDGRVTAGAALKLDSPIVSRTQVRETVRRSDRVNRNSQDERQQIDRTDIPTETDPRRSDREADPTRPPDRAVPPTREAEPPRRGDERRPPPREGDRSPDLPPREVDRPQRPDERQLPPREGDRPPDLPPREVDRPPDVPPREGDQPREGDPPKQPESDRPQDSAPERSKESGPPSGDKQPQRDQPKDQERKKDQRDERPDRDGSNA